MTSIFRYLISSYTATQSTSWTHFIATATSCNRLVQDAKKYGRLDCWHLRPAALAAGSTEDRVQDMCACIQVSRPVSTHLPLRVMHLSCSNRPTESLRSAVQGNLIISYCRTKRYGQRSFAYSGPALWNSLARTVRDPSLSLTQFCAQQKFVMFSRAQWYTFI